MQLLLGDNAYILTDEGIDCSLPLQGDEKNVRAWYVGAPKIKPVNENGWVGSVAEGGSVNFRNIAFNPHGHGTHTECLGHITKIVYSVNGMLDELLYSAILISVEPARIITTNGETDFVVTAEILKDKVKDLKSDSLLIRTLPNELIKKSKKYSDTNPVYFEAACVDVLNEMGIKHLLVDTPSVDREKDEGKLSFHHAFWEVPQNPRFDRTITEMIFVEDGVEDGEYMLNLQTAPFENDATPSRPILFPIHRYEEE